MLQKSTSKGTLLIVIAGIFWGSMGLFVRQLTAWGFTSIQVVSCRLTIAAIIFALVLLGKDRRGFIIRQRDILLFLGLGLCSILFFTCCYFTAIELMSMSVAAILLYTSPVWVMLMSAVFFGERITGNKVLALILSVAGCALVSGIGGGSITPLGLLIGLGAGFGYGLYSILGNIALKRYSAYTVTTYTFLIAAAGSFLISNPGEMITKIGIFENLPLLFGFIVLTGIVTAVVPFLCYTIGLKSVEPGRAAILATIEPIVATVLGALIFDEKITLLSGSGIICVVTAIVILSYSSAKPFERY